MMSKQKFSSFTHFSAKLSFAVLLIFLVSIFTNLTTYAGLGPTASFTADRTFVAIGETVNVDASASFDSRGMSNLQYRWDFESTHTWTPWSRSPFASYTFKDNGEKTIRLEVKDGDGYTDETKVLIRIKSDTGNTGPVSAFVATPTTGDINTFFKFTITSAISAVGTPLDQLQFRWDFECDGKFDTDYTPGMIAYHAYSAEGLKTVCLETRDINGVTGLEQGYYVKGKENDSARTREVGRILVNKSTQPLASFRTYPTSGAVGVNFHFDATASIRATEFRWDFNGDGKFDTNWNQSPQIQFTYNSPGKFQLILEVKNSSGLLDRTTRLVTITESATASLPTASFTIRNITNSLNEDAGVVLDKFYFDAGRSTAGSGANSKLRVRWDFEGDGTWDTTFSTAKTAYHAYTAAGRFHPRVEVWDEGGKFAQTDVEIRIVANTPPVAVLSITPLLATKNKNFTFDASQSFDGQSRTSDLMFRFDFDGDGVYDTVFSRASRVTRSFSSVGKRTAKVEVRDSSGTVASAFAKFEVADPTPPVARFTVTPSVGTFSTNFQFDARDTLDPSGVGGRLSFRWDFDSTGATDIRFDTNYSPTPTITRRFTSAGSKTARLSVKNEADQTNEYSQTVFIHPDSAALEFLQRRGVMKSENPSQFISRAELAKVIVKAAGIAVKNSTTQKFTDVDPRQWYAPYVYAVVERGWISLKNNHAFRPDWTVNRAEAVKIVISALYPRVAVYDGASHFPDVKTSDWFFRFANVGATEDFKLVSANGNFDASQPMTRGEAARIVAKLLTKYEIGKYRIGVARTFDTSSFLSSLLSVITRNK